jgi:hypothetical protein
MGVPAGRRLGHRLQVSGELCSHLTSPSLPRRWSALSWPLGASSLAGVGLATAALENVSLNTALARGLINIRSRAETIPLPRPFPSHPVDASDTIVDASGTLVDPRDTLVTLVNP